MRLGLAIRAFFAALLNKQLAAPMERLLAGPETASTAEGGATRESGTAREAGTSVRAEPASPRPKAPQPSPSRDPAITLLTTLQHEARLVDLIKDDLNQYSDAQVGAAARPCLQQCAAVLDRFFSLKPLVLASEGEVVEVGANASPMRYQWIGEGTAASGKLIHHGWEATKVELPKWLGEASDANVIAPAQVQVP